MHIISDPTTEMRILVQCCGVSDGRANLVLAIIDEVFGLSI